MFKIYTFYKVYIIVISPFKALFENALKANFLKHNASLIKDKQVLAEILQFFIKIT